MLAAHLGLTLGPGLPNQSRLDRVISHTPSVDPHHRQKWATVFAMSSCCVDPDITRVRMGDVSFPLGAYPVEEMVPIQGYAVLFEAADGNNADDWEEWPDRYVFDIVITTDRLNSLVRHLLTLLPGRIYPILDILGIDAYREIDPYVSYELIGLDNFTYTINLYEPFFYADGLVGFGAMSDEPFLYFFVDEHKIITLRCTMDARDRIEKVLRAFDLEEIEEPAGADAAVHEHRSVLLSPVDDPEILGFEEIVEEVRESWRLILNVDSESNLDDNGRELGITNWRMLARAEYESDPLVRYVEIFLRAGCLREAEEMGRVCANSLFDTEKRQPTLAAVVELDRIAPQTFEDMLKTAQSPITAPPQEPGMIFARCTSLMHNNLSKPWTTRINPDQKYFKTLPPVK